MTRKLLLLLVAVISLAMLVPGLSFGQSPHTPSPVSVPSIATTNPALSTNDHSLGSHTTYRHYFPPNFHAQTKDVNGVISPLYTNSPAPMGVGSFGITNNSGTLTGYVLNTTSFEGTAVLNNLTTMYLMNSGPDQYTMQLNTILENVTLFGNTGFTFWNQNVLLYTAGNHTLSFEDNIWNFTSTAFDLTNNSLYSYDGHIVAPVYYYAVGPSLNVTYPFTVHLFLNSTIIDNRDAVFFNYSVIAPSGTYSGSYDRVIFNSTYGTSPSFKTPGAYYQINGLQLSKANLPIDAELMIGGPGGGSQTNVISINGSMTLKYLPKGSSSGQYVSVPSAYDFGSDTGETSSGIAEWWSGDTVHLGSGPSLLYPMWNISSNSGYQSFSGSVTPSNSFIFISNGTFNDSYAAWAPVSSDGSFDFQLPPNTYSGTVLMSNYDQLNFTFDRSTNLNINLVYNSEKGIYTPLVAMDNQQLKYISSGGSGTEGNPYMLENNQYYGINPLFGEWNDYLFPVFSGILLVDTTSYVTISHAAPFLIDYPSYTYAILNEIGLPTFNFMPTELYNTSHVSIIDSTFTGWFYSNFESTYYYPVIGNVLTWNSTDTLIAGNNFNDMGSALVVYGGTGNLIWGNNFETSVSVATKPSSVAYGQIPVGLSIYSSNNTIYNNYFNVLITTVSPAYNPYNGAEQLYNNTWNITSEPSSTVTVFNGHSLSGSVVNNGFVSGNVYWDAIPGVPYNNSLFQPYNLSIASGYDYSPVIPSTFNVTVTVNNILRGESATVYLVQNSNYQYLFENQGSSSVTLPVYNGTYYIVVVANGNFYFNANQIVTVNGASTSVTVNV
ncbi:MAG: thermopsin [Candidatus Thermoplasmatota archaeon]|jgi:thermopsin|nr:thermopsin [Candidatus Thermoplasmatota archaeon]MCL5789013.1 thermopsin [Candidatus Thermoplasmatota archaeon]